MIGETVGSYRIVSKLSVGGMGTVYRAEHVLIGRQAAVKILHPELSANQEIVNRFFLEAKATTTIKHPGIVDIFDFGYMESGHAFLVMEFLEGMSLAHRIEQIETLGEGEAALLLRGVCIALSAAHDLGIIHRDLKPDNIFLVPDAESPLGVRPKILDFGIAKLTDIGMAGSGTKTGAVMGTPTYMSPEQCRGTGNVDARADLYSLGCIFYELVCGQPPFTDLGAGELIGAHLFVAPVAPSALVPGLSQETDTLILALLAKTPSKRPQTSRELGQRLLAIAQHQGAATTNPSYATLPVLPPLVLEPPEGQDRNTPPPPSPTLAPLSTEPTQLAVPKPTTLSGAASSIIDIPQPSRKGLFLGVAAAVVGVVVGFVVFTASGSHPPSAPVTTPSAAPVVATPTLPPPPVAPPVEPAAAVIEEPPPVEPPPAVVAKPVVKPVVKKTVKATAKVPPPVTKPAVKKNSLIETDL